MSSSLLDVKGPWRSGEKKSLLDLIPRLASKRRFGLAHHNTVEMLGVQIGIIVACILTTVGMSKSYSPPPESYAHLGAWLWA